MWKFRVVLNYVPYEMVGSLGGNITFTCVPGFAGGGMAAVDVMSAGGASAVLKVEISVGR